MQEEHQTGQISLNLRLIVSSVLSLVTGGISYFISYVISINYDNTPRGEVDPEWSPLFSDETLSTISIVVVVIAFFFFLYVFKNEHKKIA